MGAGHVHGHTHAGATGHPGRLRVAFGLTAGMVVAQAAGAIITGSLALLTDTVHALTDAIGLLVALVAAHLMTRPASSKHTWGFRRVEVIAALGQATLLLGVGIFAAVEGVRRLVEPREVPPTELLVFGAVGLACNVVAILVLSSSRESNFNMRAAFLEVVNDALGSLGVIVAAVVIATTGFQRADTVAALFIAALILPRAVRIMRETAAVLMEFTPHGLDLDLFREHIMALHHVVDVHDVHASTVATGLPTISAHVVVEDECFRDGHAADLLRDVKTCVAEHFDVSVHHSTFQIETADIRDSESHEVLHA
ncbi:cation diffusion facilitator family transporter [Kocuria marina]|uniref:cation diffusion facilitator family transporter n=1 Tax=Kocuria marina TaxID=223184 RepID=UPI0019D11098|nr:cation diffusion facilitator family transporter [Kocuria indica]MBN6812187.1 cation transporter [Kocuria indica]MBN6843935.1 cation transporter [Kocuria indica]